MSRMLGTVSMGVRAPIIRQGDDMVKIVTDCILDAMKYDGLQPRNRDIVAMTEAIVARARATMPPSTTSPPTSATSWAARPSASSSPS